MSTGVFREHVATVASISNYQPTPASMHAARFRLTTATYDFAVDGAVPTTGTLTIALRDAIPANAVITRVFATTETALTGTGALIGVGVVAQEDILAETAITGAPWTAGTHNVAVITALPVTTTANPTGTTSLILSAGTAATEAGLVHFTVEYLEASK